ncbi:tetratricopeptide (TPR) repeat protein [Sphingomonas sp. BE123]|uniref:tetratricopeptide repeat protein n=1 Tax=Sphingomonas sp. BE123 TaxID=2817842 RepID=UPI00285DBC11|nr:tetratricopeptide repeat protein [Sphingomonas sp. BE123]MDR6853094.1 tetratricopeptide (TPR) repeat protein [Sphingomonas sp. BE123]
MLLAAMTLVQDAAALEAAGRYADAERARRTRYEETQRRGADSVATADAAEKLADNLAMQLRLADAEPLYRRAFEIRLAKRGETHGDTARSLRQLAALAMARGALTEAEALARRSLDIQRTASPGQMELAWALNALAEVLAAQGKAFDADPLFNEAVTIARQAGDPDLAILLNNRGNNFYRMATATVIPPLFRRRAGATRSVVAPTDMDESGGLDPIRKRSFLAQGRALLDEAMRLFTAASGADHPDVANLLNGLAAHYRAAGMIAEAEDRYRRALAIKARFLPPDNRDRIVGEWSLGDLLATRPGREAEARTRLRAAMNGAMVSQGRFRTFDAAASQELRNYAPVFATSIRVAWRLSLTSAPPAR